MTTRRGFLFGLTAVLAAPAIVRPGILMPVKQMLEARPAWLPDGFMLPEGQLLSRSAYSELFAAVGTNYGGGPTTFRLPDFRGRLPVMAASGLPVQAAYIIAAKGSDMVPAGSIVPCFPPSAAA